MSLGAGVCGASKNIFRASMYFQFSGTGWVCRTGDSFFSDLESNVQKQKQQRTVVAVILYLSVDMQNHILDIMVLLDQF